MHITFERYRNVIGIFKRSLDTWHASNLTLGQYCGNLRTKLSPIGWRFTFFNDVIFTTMERVAIWVKRESVLQKTAYYTSSHMVTTNWYQIFSNPRSNRTKNLPSASFHLTACCWQAPRKFSFQACVCLDCLILWNGTHKL